MERLTRMLLCVCFPTAYKEKMKELSVFSLICSCFYPEAHNKRVCEFEGMDRLIFPSDQTYCPLVVFSAL